MGRNVIGSGRVRKNGPANNAVLHSRILRGRLGGLLQFSNGEAVKIFLASVSSGIRAMWPHRAWTIAER